MTAATTHHNPPGFLYRGDLAETRRIYFIEYFGKDSSFDRWRFSLYYAPHLAATHFEHSEEDARRFLDRHQKYTSPDYSAWRGAFEAGAAGGMDTQEHRP